MQRSPEETVAKYAKPELYLFAMLFTDILEYLWKDFCNGLRSQPDPERSEGSTPKKESQVTFR